MTCRNLLYGALFIFAATMFAVDRSQLQAERQLIAVLTHQNHYRYGYRYRDCNGKIVHLTSDHYIQHKAPCSVKGGQ